MLWGLQRVRTFCDLCKPRIIVSLRNSMVFNSQLMPPGFCTRKQRQMRTCCCYFLHWGNHESIFSRKLTVKLMMLRYRSWYEGTCVKGQSHKEIQSSRKRLTVESTRIRVVKLANRFLLLVDFNVLSSVIIGRLQS